MKIIKSIPLILLIISIATTSQAQDQKALDIYNQCVAAMGGMKNYNTTNVIEWTFFGNRHHTWDKKNNIVRIDYLKEDTHMVVNLNNLSGQVIKLGKKINEPDSLKYYLNEGRKAWINDSYWLVMPFKLIDQGVNLKYLGEMKGYKDAPSDVIEVTFNEVGVSPENKYHMYFDKSTKLITQWSFFGKASDEKPRFTMPWLDYAPYGKILLSGNRGERKLDNIAVSKKVAKGKFTL